VKDALLQSTNGGIFNFENGAFLGELSEIKNKQNEIMLLGGGNFIFLLIIMIFIMIILIIIYKKVLSRSRMRSFWFGSTQF